MGPESEVVVLPVLLPIHVVQAEVETPRVSSIQPLAEGHHVLVGPGPLPVCCPVLFLLSSAPLKPHHNVNHTLLPRLHSLTHEGTTHSRGNNSFTSSNSNLTAQYSSKTEFGN